MLHFASHTTKLAERLEQALMSQAFFFLIQRRCSTQHLRRVDASSCRRPELGCPLIIEMIRTGESQARIEDELVSLAGFHRNGRLNSVMLFLQLRNQGGRNYAATINTMRLIADSIE